MIQEIVQYRFVCDACGKTTGAHHNPGTLLSDLLKVGWEGAPPPEGDHSHPRRMWRCPRCVNLGQFPKGWSGEVVDAP